MHRQTTATANEVWRATITYCSVNGPIWTVYAGPYLVKAAATTAINRAIRRNRNAYGHQATDVVTGTVQRGVVTWSDLPE